MSANLKTFVGKVAQQAAAEALVRETAMRRNNALLAGGLVLFGGCAGNIFFCVLSTLMPTSYHTCSFCALGASRFVYWRTFSTLTNDDFSDVDVQEVRHRLDQRAIDQAKK